MVPGKSASHAKEVTPIPVVRAVVYLALLFGAAVYFTFLILSR